VVKSFFSEEELREHIKTMHPEKIRYILSKLHPSEIENLKKRGIDPEEWALGYLIAYMQEEGSN